MPLFDMTEEGFMRGLDVWSFGRDPVRIDLMTAVKGLDFDEVFGLAEYYTEDNVTFRFLHINNLMAAKRLSGRHRDLDDIEQLLKKDKQ